MAMPMPQDPGASPQGGAPKPGQGKPSQGGSPSDLLMQAMDNLMRVGEIMSQSKAVPPQDVQKYGQIVSALQNFIEQDLGGAPGEKDKGPPPPPGGTPAPEQAGGNQKAMPAPAY